MTTVIEKCDCGYIFIEENICYILFVWIVQRMLAKTEFRNYLNYTREELS